MTTDERAKARLAVCRLCKEREVKKVDLGGGSVVEIERCKNCGCALAMKTRAPQAGCPLGFWLPVED